MLAGVARYWTSPDCVGAPKPYCISQSAQQSKRDLCTVADSGFGRRDEERLADTIPSGDHNEKQKSTLTVLGKSSAKRQRSLPASSLLFCLERRSRAKDKKEIKG